MKKIIFIVAGFLFLSLLVHVWQKQGLATQGEVLCLAHVSDAHVEIGNHAEKLAEAVKYFNNSLKPPFIINTGDVAENDLSVTPNCCRGNYEIYKNIISASLSPVYTIPGNHDYPKEAADFEAVLGSPRESFDSGSYRFIGFYSYEVDLGWLEEQLRNFPLGKGIIFTHQPLDHSIDWTKAPEVEANTNKTIKELMLKYQALVSLSGHFHSAFVFYNPTSKTLDIDAPAILNGKYNLICLDDNKVSSLTLNVGQMPIVIITQPEGYTFDAHQTGEDFFAGERGKVSGLVKIRTKVFSDIGVASVQYKIDNGRWLTLNNLSNDIWEGQWNSSSAGAGKHTIRAKVTDVIHGYFETKIEVLVK